MPYIHCKMFISVLLFSLRFYAHFITQWRNYPDTATTTMGSAAVH